MPDTDDMLSPLERSAHDASRASQAHAERLAPLYEQLALCREDAPVPCALEEQVQQELDSLHRTGTALRGAYLQTEAMADELSARLHDTRKAVDRKWYKANPPSNSRIDYQEQRSGHFARGMNLYKLGLILFIGSFAGVVIELLWCLVRHGYIESRSGLVWGPFNLLYGVGAAALSLCLYRWRNRGKWLSFLGGFAIGSAVEYACSWLMETLFGSKSWDYSNMAFHLNGRICLLYSIFWGLLGVIWIKDIYPRMAKWILKLPDRAGKILTWALVIFLAVNTAVSGLAVHRWSERTNGLPPSSALEELLDQRFPDERMQRVYANMTFD